MAVRGVLDSQSQVFWLADRGVAIVRLLSANKELVLVSVLVFAVAQPRRALRWAVRAWGLFRLVRQISRVFA
jgi:hypothetical protein